jgi:TorA maturation chaperone TorD
MLASAVSDRALAARLEAFSAAYGAMSRLLLAPVDRELRESLEEPGQLRSWPMPRDPDTVRALAWLSASQEAGESQAKLAGDYERLLTGPNPPLAPPYESVYRSPDRLLFDGATFEVRAAYRRLGVRAPNLNREPDDHIGLEFSFLAIACARARDALEAGDAVALDDALGLQRSFLAEHLLCWGGECLGLIEQSAATSFYKGVGALGLGVLAHAATW